MRKNIITTPAAKVKDATLFVTDYTEVGLDKTVDVSHVAIEKVVDAAQASVVGARIAGSCAKTAWTNHRNAKADRLVTRKMNRIERKGHKGIEVAETETTL